MEQVNTAAANKAIINDLYKAANARNFSDAEKNVSPAYRHLSGATGSSVFTSQLRKLLEAFPDGAWIVRQLIAEGNYVVVRQTFTGRHTATFQDIPATNRNVATDGIVIYQLDDRRIVDYWMLTDRLSFLQELGVLPSGNNALSPAVKHEEVALIDKFTMPSSSRAAFIERMNYNENMIRRLPGFVSADAFETQQENVLTVTTVAIWKNMQHLDNARESVKAHYQQLGFNLGSFLETLNAKMERSILQRMKR